jgi:hypothetical protein
MSITRYQGVNEYVGNTPLIRLRRLSELTALLEKILAHEWGGLWWNLRPTPRNL